MALSATVVWEVRPAGSGSSDDNGGGYKSDAGTTDYSQQDAAELTLTDLACAIAATALTSVTGGFTAAMVGSIIQIKSGTNFTAGFYQITAYTSTNQVTIDRTACDGVGDASVGTGSVGGALATPGAAAINATPEGHVIWVKAGTYTLSTATPGAGGPVLLGLNHRLRMEGYQTTRGDRGTKPVLDAGAQTNLSLFASQPHPSNHNQHFINLKADGNSQSTIIGFSSSVLGYAFAIDCEAVDCDTRGFVFFACVNCLADTCGVGFLSCDAHSSEAKNSTGIGFEHCKAFGCLANNGDADGFDATTISIFINCLAYSNTGDGFSGDGRAARIINCLAANNGGWGFDHDGAYGPATLINCAAYNNTSGAYDTTEEMIVDGFVSITDGDPFVDAASGDFRPNNTADRGALLRAAGIGIVSQTNNTDIGAVQHSDEYYGGASGRLTLTKETGAAARGGSGTCAKLLPTSTTAYGHWTFFVPVTASTEFTLSLWYWATSGFNGDFDVTIYDTDNTTVLTADDVGETADGTWREFTATPVTPTATGLCRVEVSVEQGAHSAADLIYIDDVSIA